MASQDGDVNGLVGPGQSFGDSALSNQAPHDFTYVAEGPVTLLVMTKDALDHLCGNLAEVQNRGISDDEEKAVLLIEKIQISGTNLLDFNHLLHVRK